MEVTHRSRLLAAFVSVLAGADVAYAQGVIAIPAPAFSDATGRKVLNATGTTTAFPDNPVVRSLFAPANLPHGANVTRFTCAGTAQTPGKGLIFILRRNEPQQENISIARIETDVAENNWTRVTTTDITSPTINNERYNYYIVVEINARTAPGVTPSCNNNLCSVNYCAIHYDERV